MSINKKQFQALKDYFMLIENGFYDENILMDKITLKLDDSTNTVTIEIWDMDDQDFKDFKV